MTWRVVIATGQKALSQTANAARGDWGSKSDKKFQGEQLTTYCKEVEPSYCNTWPDIAYFVSFFHGPQLNSPC